jgi:hypothetical protein
MVTITAAASVKETSIVSVSSKNLSKSVASSRLIAVESDTLIYEMVGAV